MQWKPTNFHAIIYNHDLFFIFVQRVTLLIIYSILVFRWNPIGQGRESNKTYLLYHTANFAQLSVSGSDLHLYSQSALWEDPPLHNCIHAT